jgi:hypothetical protein
MWYCICIALMCSYMRLLLVDVFHLVAWNAEGFGLPGQASWTKGRRFLRCDFGQLLQEASKPFQCKVKKSEAWDYYTSKAEPPPY